MILSIDKIVIVILFMIAQYSLTFSSISLSLFLTHTSHLSLFVTHYLSNTAIYEDDTHSLSLSLTLFFLRLSLFQAHTHTESLYLVIRQRQHIGTIRRWSISSNLSYSTIQSGNQFSMQYYIIFFLYLIQLSFGPIRRKSWQEDIVRKLFQHKKRIYPIVFIPTQE